MHVCHGLFRLRRSSASVCSARLRRVRVSRRARVTRRGRELGRVLCSRALRVRCSRAVRARVRRGCNVYVALHGGRWSCDGRIGAVLPMRLSLQCVLLHYRRKTMLRCQFSWRLSM